MDESVFERASMRFASFVGVGEGDKIVGVIDWNIPDKSLAGLEGLCGVCGGGDGDFCFCFGDPYVIETLPFLCGKGESGLFSISVEGSLLCLSFDAAGSETSTDTFRRFRG